MWTKVNTGRRVCTLETYSVEFPTRDAAALNIGMEPCG
jgi:hypothetical protein